MMAEVKVFKIDFIELGGYQARMLMSFWNHLEEFRQRLLKIVLILVGATFLSFWGADWILQYLLRPYLFSSQTLTSLQPAGVFIQSMRLALIGGLLLSLPLILYHLWSFISPGLIATERKVFVLSLYAGTLLFIIGILFAYFLVVPKALNFFWNYSQHLGVSPTWTIEHYLNFVLMFCLSFGIAFELPLVLVLLVRFKIVTVDWLSAKRPHIIIVLALVAAILTPPDVVSQLMLLFPLWLLFEFSLLIARL